MTAHTLFVQCFWERTESKSYIVAHPKKFHPNPLRIPRPTLQLQRLYHKYTASPAFSESIIFTEYMVRSQSLCSVGLDSITRHREILDKCKKFSYCTQKLSPARKENVCRNPGYMIAPWTWYYCLATLNQMHFSPQEMLFQVFSNTSWVTYHQCISYGKAHWGTQLEVPTAWSCCPWCPLLCCMTSMLKPGEWNFIAADAEQQNRFQLPKQLLGNLTK